MRPIATLFICFIFVLSSGSKLLGQASCVGTATLNVTINTCVTGELVQASAFLQGPYNNGTGNMVVPAGFFNLIPLNQPYNRPPWNYSGTESIASKPASMIDWVLLEVYDITGTNLIETKAALLLNNGSIVDPAYATNQTITGVYFNNIITNNSYRLVVRHRNHLAIMSNTAVSLPNTTPYQFTNPSNVLGGNGQLANVGGGNHAMLAGDFNSDGVFSLSDYNGYAATGATNQYLDGDFNLDGSITVGDFNLYRPNSSIIGMENIRY
ncbi:MAG: hypothetical protein IPM47_10655 [Sphingobacteriales bacterium]|nr:MAG: hypothetical protein IPM47_10655 [Sphingobacteriales bacterium]